MKKLFISAILSSVMLCTSVSVGAALISPGISVIQQSVVMEKSGVAKNTIAFTEEDFENVLGVRSVSDLKITSLPEAGAGALMLGESIVSVGDIIAKEDISKLCFVPSANGVNARFCFIPIESEYQSSFTCVISMTKENIDLAPMTRSDTISDMAGITVFSVLCAEDNDGGELKFSIVSGASHGTVEIVDVKTGAYRYTPDDGFYGKDKFTFCVTDAAGNVSNVSTVTVNVAKNEKNIVYSDMEGSAHHLAAAVLFENDIMLGSFDGAARVFKPNGTVTRSDFLIMAMKTAGIKAKECKSGFADEVEFSPYEQRYIATASELHLAVGIDTENGRCFMPDRAITDEEAALIVCRIAALEGLDIVEHDVAAAVMDNDGYDALSVLSNVGIYHSDDGEKALSRADTVQILYSLFEYKEKE